MRFAKLPAGSRTQPMSRESQSLTALTSGDSETIIAGGRLTHTHTHNHSTQRCPDADPCGPGAAQPGNGGLEVRSSAPAGCVETRLRVQPLPAAVRSHCCLRGLDVRRERTLCPTAADAHTSRGAHLRMLASRCDCTCLHRCSWVAMCRRRSADDRTPW